MPSPQALIQDAQALIKSTNQASQDTADLVTKLQRDYEQLSAQHEKNHQQMNQRIDQIMQDFDKATSKFVNKSAK